MGGSEQPQSSTVIENGEESTESSKPDDDQVVEIAPEGFGEDASHAAAEVGDRALSPETEEPAGALWRSPESKGMLDTSVW